ncbi:transglutaminase-like putative cysteine protease [Marmoricola sp. OAE513]|uniref:transglutaminase family protein n=1 Tax=Marmoricola sp. OAE513 TaxID=2817894 RepID=UPI001AE3C4CB
MTVQLKVVHKTEFTYEGGAAASFNEARLTPQTTAGQIVVHTRLDVHPTPWSWSYRDYWGTQVTAFEILDPHDSLTVTATATVHTEKLDSPVERLSWSELHSDPVTDRFTELLHIRDRVRPPADLAARFAEIGTASPDPESAARAVCSLIHDEVDYVVGSTHVQGLAADSWEARAGVCQDMAHLVIGGLRQLGIPARYVSGYLHPESEPELGVSVRGESHAWIQWWDGGWRGWDPTNDTAPAERHVVVATGRNYADVKPLSGIFSGGGKSTMAVDVQVTRIG